MLNPLSKDFRMSRYGLDVRLVTEEDTDYILSLRTDNKLARYLHPTENDRQKQLEWLKKYKIRESDARDYYFIYFKGEKPVGLNRAYNIFDYYCTSGSWICSPENDYEDSLATFFILHDIIFETLNLDLILFDVRKSNSQVLKLHKKCGARLVGESEIDYYFVTNRNDYLQSKDGLLEMFNIK